MSATRSYNQSYDGYGSSGEPEIKYTRKPTYHGSGSEGEGVKSSKGHHSRKASCECKNCDADRPTSKRRDSDKSSSKKSLSRTNTQQHTPPASPQRRSTRNFKDEEGNEVEEAEEGASMRPRAHGWVSSDDEDSHGKSTKKSSVQNSRINGGRASPTSRYKNADGDDEQVWEGSHAPGIRTHDHSDQNAIDEKLFGKNAPKPPSRSTSSYDRENKKSSSRSPPRRTNSGRDHVEEHSGDELPAVRTHDHSNQDEINAKLFGKGAKNADSGRKSPPRRTNTSGSSRGNRDTVEEHSGDELPAVRTHDHSNQDEINAKLFGKGAKNARD